MQDRLFSSTLQDDTAGCCAVCTRAISWLVLVRQLLQHCRCWVHSLFQWSFIDLFGKRVCSGQMWETKLCNKMYFYLLLCLTEGWYFCWTLNWIVNCSDLQNSNMQNKIYDISNLPEWVSKYLHIWYHQKSNIVHLYYKVYQALGPTSRDDKVHIFKERDEIHQVLSDSGESHWFNKSYVHLAIM